MKQPTIHSFALACALGVAACSGGADRSPVGPTPLGAAEAPAGSEAVTSFSSGPGCRTVEYDTAGSPTGTPGVFAGVVTGDLEGTFTQVFDVTSITLAGVTVHNSGTFYWEITGGVFPDLESFTTHFDNANILLDRPGSPGTLFENKGKHRALSGVSKANLTYKGTSDTVPSPPVINWHYQGVICP